MKLGFRLSSLCALSLLCLATAEAEVFKPKTFTLNNGLQVVLVQNNIAPVVSVAVIYKVGTADDAITGLSHFLEHLMFKGTKDVPADQYTQTLLSKGGQFNAHTTADSTVYTTRIAAIHLDTILKIEADRMQNLVFDDKIIESERKVVQEERLMRLDNSPYGPAQEAMQRVLFLVHPYGIPPIGYSYQIDAYNKEGLQKHYQTYYVPNNAILLVSGDVSEEKLKPMVDKHFSALKKQDLPERVRPQEPERKVQMEMSFHSPRVTHMGISWAYTAPNHRGVKQKHFYPLIVLDQILAGNETARLYSVLVEKKKLAVSVHSHYAVTTYDPHPMTIEASLAPNATLEDLKKGLAEEIADIVKNGVTDEDVDNAKRDLLAELTFAKDQIHKTYRFFEHLANGVSVEEIEAYPDNIQKVTKEMIHEAAQEVLGRDPILKATFAPEKK